MKRTSLILVVALVVAILGSVAVQDAEALSYFNYNQQTGCTSTGWFFVGAWNFNTGTWSSTQNMRYSGTVHWVMPYGAWFGMYIYDFSTAKWDEAFWLYNQNW